MSEQHIPGHIGNGQEIDCEIPGVPADALLATCRPCRYGPAILLAVVRHCFVCNAEVWRSVNAPPTGMVIVCYDCMDEFCPGWDANAPEGVRP